MICCLFCLFDWRKVCGYTVTLTILFYRSFGDANLRYVDFFHKLSFIASIACMVGMVVAGIYFAIAMRDLVPYVSHIPLEEVTTKGTSLEGMIEEEKENDEVEEARLHKVISFGVSVDDRSLEKVDQLMMMMHEPALLEGAPSPVAAQAVTA